MIVSPPVPPITIALPSPTVIVSLSPLAMPGFVVWTRPTVIGSEPNCDGLPLTPSISPLSPRMMFVPEPPRIVSWPLPPTTIAWPAPIVIWSLPPSVGSVDITRSMSRGSAFAPAHGAWPPFSSVPTHVIRPSSPKTKFVLPVVPAEPTTVEIVSLPVPPITIELPEPVLMVSLPPTPGSVVSTIPSVIGSVPNCVATDCCCAA